MDESDPWRIELVGLLGAVCITALIPISFGLWAYTGDPAMMFKAINWFAKYGLLMFIFLMVYAAIGDVATMKRRSSCR